MGDAGCRCQAAGGEKCRGARSRRGELRRWHRAWLAGVKQERWRGAEAAPTEAAHATPQVSSTVASPVRHKTTHLPRGQGSAPKPGGFLATHTLLNVPKRMNSSSRSRSEMADGRFPGGAAHSRHRHEYDNRTSQALRPAFCLPGTPGAGLGVKRAGLTYVHFCHCASTHCTTFWKLLMITNNYVRSLLSW